jgi:hypothetical protein
MTWAYALGTEGRWPSHSRVTYDGELARYRWNFLPVGDSYWTLDQALVALKAGGAIGDAEAYLAHYAPKENIFGVVYDDGQQADLGLPPMSERQTSSQLLQRAIKDFERGRDASTPNRADVLEGSRGQSFEAYKKNPNNLDIHLFWSNRGFRSDDFRAAVVEWLHAYFRVLAVCRSALALATPRLLVRRSCGAHPEFTQLAELERLRTTLQLGALLNPTHLQQIRAVTGKWKEVQQKLSQSGTADFIDYLRKQIALLEYPPGNNLETNPKVITNFAESLPRPDDFHALLLSALPALERLLSGNNRRAEALEALVAIADPRCSSILGRAGASATNPAWRGELEKAQGRIQAKIAERGASWIP